jgi:sensor histidine kinase YesM
MQLPIKKLYRLALFSSPVIALAMITPLLILLPTHVDLPMRLEFVFFAANLVVFLFWTLHIELMRRWLLLRQPVKRFFLAGAIMTLVSAIVMILVNTQEPFPIPLWQAHAMRLLNVVAVDGIVLLLSQTLLLAYERKQLADENEQLKFLNLEFKYQRLKAQINPHFLFNAISIAKPLIRRSPEAAEAYLLRLSRFLRAAIGAEKDLVRLQEELDLVADFVEMQKCRFGDALQVDINIDTPLKQLFLPHFSLITLLENAIKHNAMTEAEPLKVEIRSQDVQLFVSNRRREKFVLEASTKTGLANLEQRYSLLSGQTIRIEQTAEVFAVALPLLLTL